MANQPKDVSDLDSYIRELWLRRINLSLLYLAVPLCLGFSFIDYIWTPDNWRLFLVIRIVVCTVFAIVLCIIKISPGAASRHVELLSYVTTGSLGLGIGFMTSKTGGLSSPYYAGLNFVVIGSLAFWPCPGLGKLATIMSIFGPLFVFEAASNRTAIDSEAVVSIAFMLGTSIIGIIISILSQRSLEEERRLRTKVEKHLLERNAAYELIVSTTQMVAHDMQRPLLYMANFNRLLSQSKSLEDLKMTCSKYSTSVASVLSSAETMIGDILSVGGTRNFELAPTSLNKVLHHAVVSARNWSEMSGIKMNFSLSHRNQVYGSEFQLVRVIENIVSNAAKAINGAGRIDFHTAESADGTVTLTIQNNGPAIPTDLVERIFEPFVSGDRKRRRGLGLTICRQIIEAHGGRIWADSNPGSGAAFTICLRSSEDSETYGSDTLVCMDTAMVVIGESRG